MTKKLLPPQKAERLLWLVVHFSVRMLSRYLDPWSKYGADVLIEYVDSLWHPPRKGNSRKVISPYDRQEPRGLAINEEGSPPSDDLSSGKRHSP